MARGTVTKHSSSKLWYAKLGSTKVQQQICQLSIDDGKSGVVAQKSCTTDMWGQCKIMIIGHTGQRRSPSFIISSPGFSNSLEFLRFCFITVSRFLKKTACEVIEKLKITK